MREAPKRFIEFGKKYPKVREAYENLGTQCQKAGPLNDRERAFAKIGAAVGSSMEGSVHAQVRKALDAGLNPDEIRHAIVLTLTTIGFPKMIAAWTWAEDILRGENSGAR